MLSPSRVDGNFLPSFPHAKRERSDPQILDVSTFQSSRKKLSPTQKAFYKKTPSNTADDDTESLRMAFRDSTLQTTLSGGGT